MSQAKHGSVLRNARLEAARTAPPQPQPPDPVVTERCGYCSFAVTAPLEEARALFRAHACVVGVGDDSETTPGPHQQRI